MTTKDTVSTHDSGFNPDEIIMTKAEEDSAAILALEGQEVTKYDVYLSRLRQAGSITAEQAGHAAVVYAKTGDMIY